MFLVFGNIRLYFFIKGDVKMAENKKFDARI
jgi:hypothetical protein